MTSYDLIAIGSGPAGQHAAIQAAKLGKRVALVEREVALGGVSTNTGTLPSKTLRAAILGLAGQARASYGGPYRLQHEVTIDDLFWRTQLVIDREREVVRDQLRRNQVEVLSGVASFLDPHTLDVGGTRIHADHFVIAVGTKPARPAHIDFDGRVVLDADEILRLKQIPRRLSVIGGGVIGLEYASMAAVLGVHVTVVDEAPSLLEFVDAEIVEALEYHLRGLGLVLRLGEVVEAVTQENDGVAVHMKRGEPLPADTVLFTGRRGATDDLGLAAAGLEADPQGRIAVGLHFRTAQPHIFAAGDVVGFPNLSSASMAQGRLAALAAFDRAVDEEASLHPHAIYTVPELSFVGRSESELAEASIPHVVGRARYRELVRGEIAGERSGLLKLVVHAQTRCILGVHIFGSSATELVHLGQAVIAGELTVDYFRDAVFNVPTFTDAYKIAAVDACSRLEELANAA